MRYYLYSKAISPETVLEQIKRKGKNRHPAITCVAVLKKNVGIHFSLVEFADKYLDGGSSAMRWVMANPAEKRQMFIDYMSKNQEREDYNNFAIVAGAGTVKYEPVDFIKHVENVNNSFKKVPNEN